MHPSRFLEVSPFWWTLSSARTSTWTAHYPLLSVTSNCLPCVTLLPLSWRPSVPSSTKVPRLDVGSEEFHVRACPPRHNTLSCQENRAHCCILRLGTIAYRKCAINSSLNLFVGHSIYVACYAGLVVWSRTCPDLLASKLSTLSRACRRR